MQGRAVYYSVGFSNCSCCAFGARSAQTPKEIADILCVKPFKYVSYSIVFRLHEYEMTFS